MDPDVVTARFGAQLLTERRARSAVDVVGHLLAVQAQDARGARLAVRARSTGTSAAEVDLALSVDRSLAVGWLNRGTLHLVAAEDYWWLHALTTPQLTTSTFRRLRQEGLDGDDAERGVAALVRSLERHGPLTRAALREELTTAGIAAAGQALVHLLVLGTVRRLVVRGPLVGAEQAFVLAQDWLPPTGDGDREVALAELARRYLAAHGPATAEDLARWAGIPRGQARHGLAAIGDALREGPRGTVALRTHDGERPGTPPPRLLGAFDPVLLGWTSRDALLGDHVDRIVSGGVLRAFALVRGRATGTWQVAAGRVRLSLFEPPAAEDAAALAADATDVERFLQERGEAVPRAPQGLVGD